MNLWDKIIQLDNKIIKVKSQILGLMKERDELYEGLCHLEKYEPEKKLSVPEIIAQDNFVQPTQDEIAKTRRDYDAQFPPPERTEQTHT
jgi:hypothetical protein